MKKVPLIVILVILIACVSSIYYGCSSTTDSGTAPNARADGPRKHSEPRISDMRIRQGESKDDYWDRIVDTQGFPILFYGRVVDQDGKPLEGVEVRPEIQKVLGRAKRLAGLPEFVKCPPVHTDSNGLFSITGYKGITLSFMLVKEEYRTYGGAVNCQPGFSQPGFPGGYEPDPKHPVEYQMIPNDMPPTECVFDEKFRIPWNGGPIVLDLGESVGRLQVDPSRQRKDQTAMNGFDWSVGLSAEGFTLVPLEGNQPELRMAPTDGYGSTFTAGATAGDLPWLSGIYRTFAIKTEQNRYGTMKVHVGAYDDETRTGFSVTIYLGQPGLRNIDLE